MRRERDAAAVLQDDRPFGQLVFAILIALHVNVGADPVEQHFGRALGKTDDGVDAAQRKQYFGSPFERNDRPCFTL